MLAVEPQFWGLGVIYIRLPTAVSIELVVAVVIAVIVVIPSCKREVFGWVFLQFGSRVPGLYLTLNPRP